MKKLLSTISLAMFVMVGFAGKAKAETCNNNGICDPTEDFDSCSADCPMKWISGTVEELRIRINGHRYRRLLKRYRE